jgi:hypothetical protein
MRGGEQSIFDLAMIAEELRQEVLSDDGAERGEVVGAYVEGSNGFYRKRKCCQNYA